MTTNTEFNSDNYETPPEVSRHVRSLVQPWEDVLDPCAGRGNMTSELSELQTVVNFKISFDRFACGEKRDQKTGIWKDWYCQDFFEVTPNPSIDVVVMNPPFSLALEFIERSLLWLKPEPHARIIALLPNDFLLSVKRNKQFCELDAHIAHQIGIVNRVAYIRENEQLKGRQIYDAFYVVKPGKSSAEYPQFFYQD